MSCPTKAIRPALGATTPVIILSALASLDGLTGLANRRGFDRALERAWQHAGERREPLALMMIDIDHFKLFNDRYGHVSGDTCLRAVGETLSLVLLDEAVLIARYGGEEFALLLPGRDISRATALADEARVRAAELAQRARRAYQVSAKTLERLAERPNPDGLLCVAQLPDWQPDDIVLADDGLILVADAMEIPGNLGTLIRTLDACAADCLVLTSKRTRLTHPRVLRSSQGMSMKVPSLEFAEIDTAVDWLRGNDVTVYLADTSDSTNYRQADYSGRTAVVVGSERYGISPPWYDYGFSRIGIPMLGAADSLNVSVSASVILYEARARKNNW